MFKFFDVKRQELRWIGSWLFYSKTTIREMLLYVRLHMERLGLWPDDHPPSNGEVAAASFVEPSASSVTSATSASSASAAAPAAHKESKSDGKSSKSHATAAKQLLKRREELLKLSQPSLVAWEEEVGARKVPALSPDRTLEDGGYRNGDIIVVQVDYSAEQRSAFAALHAARVASVAERALAKARAQFRSPTSAGSDAPEEQGARDALLLEPFCSNGRAFLRALHLRSAITVSIASQGASPSRSSAFWSRV